MKKLLNLLFIGLFFLSCNNETEGKSTNKITEKEEVEEAIQEQEQLVIENENDFIAAFPELKKLPTTEDFKSFVFNNDETEKFSRFSSFVQWDIFTDASGETRYYQPVGKYKFNETDYILFVAENQKDTTIISTLAWYKWKDGDSRQRFAWGMPIFKKYPNGKTTGFKFVANRINSINVFKDTEAKKSVLFEYYKGRYYNMNKQIKITNKTNIPDYSFEEFCNIFPKIDANWSTNKQIKTFENKSFTDFTAFIHKKTLFGKAYISEPVDFAPKFSPLGFKQIDDSLYLIAVYNQYPDYDENEINLYLISSFDNIIDKKSFSNNKNTKSKISYFNDILNCDVKDYNLAYVAKYLLSEKGFLAEKRQFEKYLKAKLEFPYISDNKLLKGVEGSLSSILNPYSFGTSWEYKGYLETNRFYILISYMGEEITSGAHAYSANGMARLYNKSNLKQTDNLGIYSYFSDGGDETSSIIFEDKFYDENTFDEKPLTTRPKESEIKKYLTNYGFFDKEVIVRRAQQSEFKQDNGFLDLMSQIQFPFEYEPIKKENVKPEISDLNKYFSNVIDSLRFVNENVEPYLPIYLLKGKILLSDTTNLVVWQRWHRKVHYNSSYIELIPILEAGIYNNKTQNFIDIKEIPFYKEINQNIIIQLFNTNR